MEKTFIILLTIISLALGLSFIVNATSEPIQPLYTDSKSFLEVHGQTCEVATDGCNTVQIWNGKLGGATLMYCENIYGKNGQQDWSCIKEKDDSPEIRVCTLEYAPVCGIDGATYSNRCGAGNVQIKYEGQCKKLSENDQNYYETIKNRLNEKYQDKVYSVLERYKSKLDKKYSVESGFYINQKVIKKLENIISNFLIKYPQDIALPKKANNKYLMLTLLKFELMILGNELEVQLQEDNS